MDLLAAEISVQKSCYIETNQDPTREQCVTIQTCRMMFNITEQL